MMPRTGRFRFHLITTVAVFLTSAALLWLNLHGRYALGESFVYGWPFKCIRKHTYDSLTETLASIFWDKPKVDMPDRGLLAINLAICITIVFAVAFVSERWFRRPPYHGES